MSHKGTKMNENEIGKIVVDCAVRLHMEIGPGLLNKVILELKSVENIVRVHKKQVLTYLKLTGMKLGYLLNFGDVLMKDGIFRILNGKIQ